MTDDPRMPPQGTIAAARYYTDDITLMPARAIWQILRRQSLIARMLLLPFFLIRKTLKLRHIANHASSRLTELLPIREDEVPKDVQFAIAPYIEACRANRMSLVCWFRPPWIGNKTGWWSLWLDPSGSTYCNISWIDLRRRQFHKAKVVFACHSRVTSGIELHTGTLAPEHFIPELIPPNQDLLRLDPDANPSEVIQRHKERIANRRDVVRFDSESVQQEVVRRSQEQFDFMIARGFYAPLTDDEVERLLSTENPS